MSRNKKSHLVKQKIKHWPTPQEIKKKKKKKKKGKRQRLEEEKKRKIGRENMPRKAQK